MSIVTPPPPPYCSDRSVDLPVELIEVILSKSPIKSVVRFKSVSKEWHAMISDPRFSKIHRVQRAKLSVVQRRMHHGVSSSSLISMKLEGGKLKTVPELDHYLMTSFIPRCSCNGIFLFSNYRGIIILRNPSMRKSTTIIVPRPLGCQYLEPDDYHLYHDAGSEDYKIVFVNMEHYTVYSCKNECWGEEIDLPFYFSACIDGRFYRLWYDEIEFFDARDGKLYILQKPKDLVMKENVKMMAVSGRLCLYSSKVVDRPKIQIQLWVMEKMNGSFEKYCWIKMLMINVANGGNTFQPLFLINEFDDVVFHLVEGHGTSKSLYLHNEKLGVQMIEFDERFLSYFSHYEENLDMP